MLLQFHRGVQIASKSPNRQLKKECAAILEGMKVMCHSCDNDDYSGVYCFFTSYDVLHVCLLVKCTKWDVILGNIWFMMMLD